MDRSELEALSRIATDAAPEPLPEQLSLTSESTGYHANGVTMVIEDGVIPRRVRRPFDVVRAATAIAAIAAIVAVTYFLTATTSGVENDITSAGEQLPALLKVLLTLTAGFGGFGLPVVIGIYLLIKRRPRQLLDATVAFVLGFVIAWAVALAVQQFAPERLLVALTGQNVRTGRLALDLLLTGLTAFVTVSRVVGSGRLGVLAVIVVGAVGLAPLASGSVSATTIAMSILLGWAIGLILRYAAGTPTTRPSGVEVAAAMGRAGLPITVLRASKETQRGRAYSAVTADGRALRVLVLDRDREGAGSLAALWRSLRLREDTAQSQAFAMRTSLDHSTLLSYAAENAGVTTPRLRLVSLVGPDSALLAYDNIAGHTFADVDPTTLTDHALDQAYGEMSLLHRSHIAHRRLSADQLLVDERGAVWLAGISYGVVASTDLQERVDIAELLCSLALLVGPERALASGRRVVGPTRLAMALPVLQPIALSPPTRKQLRHNKDVLAQLRTGLVELTPSGTEPDHLEFRRVRPRTIITLVLGTLAAYVLIGQLTTYNLLDLFTNANWSWVVVAAATAVVSFVGATLSLSGFVPEHLHFGRTFAAQLAAGFATLVSPPAVGTVAVNVRYLQRAGLHAALASASVGVSQVFAFVLHLILLASAGIALGQTNTLEFHPPRWAFILVAVLVAAFALLFAFGPVRRGILSRVTPILSEVGPRLLTLIQRPLKIVEGIGGILLLNIAFCVCMVACVQAFGGGGSFAGIALVYLAGSTLGQAAPTPGGIGAVEAVYVAGLTAAGVDPSIALSATFLFRALTFYLPTIPGYFSLNWLQRIGAM